MSQNAHLYTLTTLSNLHVGSGEINFDIIDNQVQRDFSGLPNINASSLKGAFREHFSQMPDNKNMVTYVFGPDARENDSHQTGAFSFFEARLLSRPVRSNTRAYYNATSPKIITEFLSQASVFGIQIDGALRSSLEKLASVSVQKGEPLVFDRSSKTVLEDLNARHYDFDVSDIVSLLGEHVALMHESDLQELPLPVNARNYLVNGVSRNLWYEEVVPKETRFYFLTLVPSNIDASDESKLRGYENKFNEVSVVQIGADKSIGYGFCAMKKVSL